MFFFSRRNLTNHILKQTPLLEEVSQEEVITLVWLRRKGSTLLSSRNGLHSNTWDVPHSGPAHSTLFHNIAA